MKKRQITIKDIAKALHISPSTVSRSLADHPDISQETKNIVNAYAREHKYKPNALALSLRTNNTKTIGVILPQIVHYFFSSVLSGIEDEAEKGGYRVIICQSNENYEKEVKGAQALLEARVCGVLASVAKTTTIYNHFQELIDSDTLQALCFLIVSQTYSDCAFPEKQYLPSESFDLAHIRNEL